MESSLKMLNYLVPPAPRPIGSEKGPLSAPSEAENLPPRPPGKFQTQKFSSPPHFEFPNRFETIEFNPQPQVFSRSSYIASNFSDIQYPMRSNILGNYWRRLRPHFAG
jgi:hypothetical protein